MKGDKRTSLGFSIIEVIVAVSIIAVGFFGVTSLINLSIRLSQSASNRVVASMLAQEGVELVRNLRDSNITSVRTWLARIDPFCDPAAFPNAPCAIDFESLRTSTSCVICPASDLSNGKLYINSDGLYTHNGSGTPTPYIRTIYLEEENPLDKVNRRLRIISEVKYKLRNKEEKVSVFNYLYAWRP